jgi:hypothetical protein
MSAADRAFASSRRIPFQPAANESRLTPAQRNFPITSGMTIAVQLSRIDGVPDVACWSREPLIPVFA